MTAETKKIGIIAGGGQFPILFAQAARKEGLTVVAVAHEKESLPELEQAVDRFAWVKLGQLGRIISFFQQEGVKETAFLGPITKTNIFTDVRPDLKGLSLWNKVDSRQDDSILRAVAAELAREGIDVIESTRHLRHLMFPKGNLTGRKPTARQVEDIRFGWQVARGAGDLDIGQCVVVRNRVVLAVEAIEGTDAAIRRGGELGREKTVVIKVKKPNQDFRFDLPAIGLTTVETMLSVKSAVLAVEAGQALLFDREQVVRTAAKAKIAIVGVEELADGTLEF